MNSIAIKNCIRCAIAVFIIGSGCAKKPEGSTGATAGLYAALQEVVVLNRQLKTGKINRQVFEVKNKLLEEKIDREFREHRKEIWTYSVNILSNTPIAKATIKLTYAGKPIARYKPEDKWSGTLTPLEAMFCMLPMQMTATVIKPAFTPSEYNNLNYASTPVQLLYLDNNNCTTAFLFGNKIAAADFKIEGYRWKPVEIRLYNRNATPDQPGTSSKTGSSSKLP